MQNVRVAIYWQTRRRTPSNEDDHPIKKRELFKRKILVKICVHNFDDVEQNKIWIHPVLSAPRPNPASQSLWLHQTSLADVIDEQRAHLRQIRFFPSRCSVVRNYLTIKWTKCICSVALSHPSAVMVCIHISISKSYSHILFKIDLFEMKF